MTEHLPLWLALAIVAGAAAATAGIFLGALLVATVLVAALADRYLF